MNQEPMLDYVIRRLNETKGKHKVIANESGVPYKTLNKIVQRVTKNPGIDHIQCLHDYFRREEYKRAKAA